MVPEGGTPRSEVEELGARFQLRRAEGGQSARTSPEPPPVSRYAQVVFAIFFQESMLNTRLRGVIWRPVPKAHTTNLSCTIVYSQFFTDGYRKVGEGICGLLFLPLNFGADAANRQSRFSPFSEVFPCSRRLSPGLLGRS